jgi:ferrochelatase
MEVSALAAQTTALVVSAHGSIESLDDVPAFLQTIRRGRAAPPELIEEVTRRYASIGGRSPLLATTRAQAAALAQATGLSAFVGMRLSAPSIESAVQAALDGGATTLVSVPIAPYSLAVYHGAVLRAVDGRARVIELSEYHTDFKCIYFFARKVERWRQATSERFSTDQMQVIFTAHSLPTAVIARGDRYAVMVEETFAAVKAMLDGWTNIEQMMERSTIAPKVSMSLAYQSQGASEGPWLGPSLRDALGEAASSGKRCVLLVPIGFYADHVEILYDLDIEARQWADALGLKIERTESPNTCNELIEALANKVRNALDSAAREA